MPGLRQLTDAAESDIRRLVQQLYPAARLSRVWPLGGGVSAELVAFEIEQADGQRMRMVVRRHGRKDLQRNPHVAAHEYQLLHILHASGIPVPRPVHLDESGEILATPYMVLEFVEGAPELAPADATSLVREMAVYLAAIHRFGGTPADLSFLPDQESVVATMLRVPPRALDEALSEGALRNVLAAVWPLPHRNTARLLHGDYWPGNILWRDGRLVAIIDWEDAAVGDPLADLANGRLEILWAYGGEATETFTATYRSLTSLDFSNLPYWDLIAALRPASNLSQWGLDPLTEQAMREAHRLFVEQALEKIRSL